MTLATGRKRSIWPHPSSGLASVPVSAPGPAQRPRRFWDARFGRVLGFALGAVVKARHQARECFIRRFEAAHFGGELVLKSGFRWLASHFSAVFERQNPLAVYFVATLGSLSGRFARFVAQFEAEF